MRAIIIDDEQDSLEALQIELETYCPEIDVIASYSNPFDGLKSIEELKPDILFLDIEMPGMNGFELLNNVDDPSFNVIFVTAYDEYAIRAFEFNATDYLLKPIMRSKLVEAIDKCFDGNTKKLDRNNLDALMNNIKLQYQDQIKTIALPTSDGYEFVAIDDISYIKAESNYSWIHMGSGEKYLLAKTLKQVENILRHPQFFRSHNSWIANLNHVKKYYKGQGGYLVMSDKTQIPVSRQKKDDLFQQMII